MGTSKNDDYVLPSTMEESLRLEDQGANLYGGVEFLRTFLAAKPRRVLDVGCGTGFCSCFVAEELPAAEVVGVEPDEGRLAFARSKATLATAQECSNRR